MAFSKLRQNNLIAAYSKYTITTERKKRVERNDCKTARRWAEGARETILAPHIEPYADALAHSWVREREYVAKVQNHYHQLISWRLPDTQEPSLPLPAYNLKLIPPPENLSEDKKKLKSEIIAKRNKVRALP